jgi:hypothetical protein
MIIHKELTAQVTSCSDSGQLYDIVTSAQDNSLILKLAAQSAYIDLKCAIFLSAYLNDLVLNPTLLSIESDFPGEVSKIFKVEAERISTLNMPENSPWWDYLIQHPSGEVRKATTSNVMLPEKYKDITTLDVPSKIGLVLNPTISAKHCTILTKDSNAQVSTLAHSALQRFRQERTLVKNNQGSHKSKPAKQSKLSTLRQSTQKDQEFHPAVLVGSIIVLLAIGMGLTMFSPGKNEKAINVTSPRGGAIGSTVVTSSDPIAASNYVEAVDLANKATLMATSAKNALEWKEIVTLWNSAIAKLNDVKKQDADYEKAQSKIRKYQVIRDLHANNAVDMEK